MKLPLFRFWLGLMLLGLVQAQASEVSAITPAADDTYKVTVKATHKFTRNTDKLKERALQVAEEFCAKQGRQLKVVHVDESKSMYLMGDFAQVTLTFKPVAAAAQAPTAAPLAASTPKPLTTDELGTELTKLDELRKKGLLTDAEFDALKQKLLNRF